MAAAIVLGLLGCAALLPYVLGPPLVFAMLRFKLPVEVFAIDPAKERLPEEVRRYFGDVFTALARNGFELVSTIVLPALVPDVRSIVAVYANRSTGDQAMSTIIVATGGIETLKTRYVEFVTRFDDGVVVQTNNSPELGAFKPLPQEHTTQFRDIHDLDRLYKLHGFLAQKYRRSGRPLLRLDAEFHGNAVEYVSRVVLDETLRAQVETGYLAPTPEGLRATLRGACIMAWQEAWPAKAIRRRLCQRNAEQVLAEFEAAGG